MSPREQDILERIRARKRAEEKTVTQDLTRKDEAASNLTTADLAQARKTETEEEREDLAEESRNTADTRLPVNADTQTMQPAPASRAAVPKATGSAPAQAATGAAPARTGNGAGPLFVAEEAKNLRSQWENVQVGFVDEPRRAVEQADTLVAEAMKRLAEMFADERQKLERQWARGENVSTEDLRIALQRYRDFFGRLLSV